MRLFAVLLLAALALGEEPIFQLRAWKGTVTVRSLSRELADSKGCESQEEKVEFLVVTKPPTRQLPAMAFEPRALSGSWSLLVDRREGDGEEAVRKRGEGGGRLHVRIRGAIDPRANRYVLYLDVTPKKLVVKTTLSGIDQNRFQTFRTVTTRRPFLANFEARGELEKGGRLIRGERKFVDRKHRLPRDVIMQWTLERVDPVVAGRVRDHLGRPAVGMKVIARHTTAARAASGLPPITKEAATDKEGRFEMEAFHGWWSLQVVGYEAKGILFAGRELKDLVELKMDSAPKFDVEIKAYDLRRLPTPQILRRHFRGDVDAYLAYIAPRCRRGEMQRALLVTPPAK